MCHLQAAWHAPLSTKKINKTPLRSGAASTDRRAFYVGPSVTGEGESEKKLGIHASGPAFVALVRVHARGKRDLPAPRKPTTCKTRPRHKTDVGETSGLRRFSRAGAYVAIN